MNKSDFDNLTAIALVRVNQNMAEFKHTEIEHWKDWAFGTYCFWHDIAESCVHQSVISYTELDCADQKLRSLLGLSKELL